MTAILIPHPETQNPVFKQYEGHTLEIDYLYKVEFNGSIDILAVLKIPDMKDGKLIVNQNSYFICDWLNEYNTAIAEKKYYGKRVNQNEDKDDLLLIYAQLKNMNLPF